MKKIKLLLIFIFYIFLFLEKPLYALEIVVSNSALEKIIREIVSDIKIYQLQSEKEDFHSYEPTLSQWQKIKNAGLVIIIGTERWAKRVYELRKEKEILSLSKGEKNFLDPHLWFDLERVDALVKELTNYVSKKEPHKRDFYQKNAQKFLKSLEEVKKEYREFKNCKFKEVYILGHPVFGYLLKDSGIKQITLLKSPHKEGEPSIKALTEMYKKIKAQGIEIVFLVDPEFEKYREFFEEKGIKVIKLWSGGTYYMPGSYIELLRYNFINIKKALRCK
uniref:Zinc ABC transporter substrate-binding protein n=1 Tax=Thermodesulfobacterium geofontis TaxID=1295609 RepID=A0A7V4JPN9_9BACT